MNKKPNFGINKAVFLDRDGVINKEVHYLHKIEEFEFIDGVFESLELISNHGFILVIITNQSGIGRGIYKQNDFDTLNNWMVKQFENHNITFSGIYLCPHSPSMRCLCRKPSPGLFNQAISDLDINPEKSWMIGDSERDILAAERAKIKNTILVRSGHPIVERNTKAKFIMDSIKEASRLIVG